MFDFKKLLIKSLRQTRWGDLANAFQDIISELKSDKLSKLKYKFDVQNSGEENLKSLIVNSGFPLYIYSGFTSSLEYLKRRAESLVYERLYRGGALSYLYIMKSFFLKGGVYSLRSDEQKIFRVIRNPLESINSQAFEYFLSDQALPFIYYYDGVNPVPNPPIETGLPDLYSDSDDMAGASRILFLDINEIRDYTNHFVIEYEFLKIEDENVFQSSYTALAFEKTVNYSKREKEVAHFQPLIKVPLMMDKSVNEIVFTSYDDLLQSSEKTIWVTGDLSQVNKVQIGRGRNYDIDINPVNQCSIPLITYTPVSAYFNEIDRSVSGLHIESNIYEYSKLGISATGAVSGEVAITNFSEVAFLDNTNNLIAYAYFPSVNLTDTMYSSVCFDVRIVSTSGELF